MKISYIIPMKNVQDTIEMCIGSILSEAVEGDEIVLVDNGSSDQTLNLINKYKNAILISRPGINVGAARNEGARVAIGDLLAFVDADCILCDKWRYSVCKTLENNTIDACGSKYDVPRNANWIETVWFSQKKLKNGRVQYLNSGNLVIRREAFFNVNGFDEKLITGEDAEFGFRLNEKGYVVWENPEIRSIHLGNPKNLLGFYKKQRWHGLGAFGTLKLSLFDKPFFATLLFIVSAWISIIFVMKSFVNVNRLFYIAGALVALWIVPVLTALYRVIVYKNYQYFWRLTFLYLLYFSARAEALYRLGIIVARNKYRKSLTTK